MLCTTLLFYKAIEVLHQYNYNIIRLPLLINYNLNDFYNL